MNTATAFVGARGTDSVTLITATSAAAFKASGIDFVIQYLGSLTPQGVQDIVGAGLALMVVTYADKFNGAQTVAELRTLGLPEGCTVWLDVESIGPSVTVESLTNQINDWAAAVKAAGFMPGLYVGVGAQLTSAELYQLSVVRYWHSLSIVLDRNGAPAAPACGWSMFQLYPTTTWHGVSVDMDFCQQDYHGRLPVWVTA